MKISYHWLKDYLSIDKTPEELSVVLTSIGLEVEGIEEYHSLKGGLKGVVIGEVLTCAKHPNADKLSVTTVNAGLPEPLHIVCGAPNVAAGQKVAVATVGTVIYSGTDHFTIQKTKIRGELSEGMICAEDELGLGESHEGIMVLDSSLEPGTEAAEVFNVYSDYIFEIGLTPNRIDSASHVGVARDLAAYFSQYQIIKITKPSISAFAIDNKSTPIAVSVLNPEACPRYTGLCISGVNIGESPDWLKNRLRAIGIGPINNVVDITNYVLHELGQPLHAFDRDKIQGNKVIVRTLPDNTAFITLDGKEHKLAADDLMICDEKEGMCIAGVFGGIQSGISIETKNIFLESAYFSPTYVRRTAKRLGLSTDSSFRFERGTDPNMPPFALKRAAMLIKEIAGGTITSDITDIYPEKIENFRIKASWENINNLIGKELDREIIQSILSGLEIAIEEENETTFTAIVPPYRVDVTREADLVEEILRIYGYNNVEIPDKFNFSISLSPSPDKEESMISITNLLSSRGFNEIMCNSLSSLDYYEKFDNPEDIVRLLNPLSSDLNVYRKNLLFGALEVISYNINRKNQNLLLFEYGNVYHKHPSGTDVTSKYKENTRLGIFISGDKTDSNWISPKEKSHFFQLKAFVQLVIEKTGTGYSHVREEVSQHPLFQDCLALVLNKKIICELGAVRKNILSHFDIAQDVFYAEFDWDYVFSQLKNVHPVFHEFPKFPEVSRDLALLVDNQVTFNQIKTLTKKTENSLIKKISLFDVYENEEKLGKGKKSYAVNYIFQNPEKTLKDEEVDQIMKKLMQTYQQELDAQIR